MRTAFWILCALLAAFASENLYEGFMQLEARAAHHAGPALHSQAGRTADLDDPLDPAGH